MECAVCNAYTSVNWGNSSVVLCENHAHLTDSSLEELLHKAANISQHNSPARPSFLPSFFFSLLLFPVLFGINYLLILSISETGLIDVPKLLAVMASLLVINVLFLIPSIPLLMIICYSLTYAWAITKLEEHQLTIVNQRILKSVISVLTGFFVFLATIALTGIQGSIWNFIACIPMLVCIGLLVGPVRHIGKSDK